MKTKKKKLKLAWLLISTLICPDSTIATKQLSTGIAFTVTVKEEVRLFSTYLWYHLPADNT
ncbi:MAG: hypothetical protein FJZ88_01645 [Chloroflexi bacterium]|nr:hypothetical protein [Chloroflexota bacterium]